jgi:hypothetical protein
MASETASFAVREGFLHASRTRINARENGTSFQGLRAAI